MGMLRIELEVRHRRRLGIAFEVGAIERGRQDVILATGNHQQRRTRFGKVNRGILGQGTAIEPARFRYDHRLIGGALLGERQGVDPGVLKLRKGHVPGLRG